MTLTATVANTPINAQYFATVLVKLNRYFIPCSHGRTVCWTVLPCEHFLSDFFPVREIQQVGYLGPKSDRTPDRTSVSRASTRCPVQPDFESEKFRVRIEPERTGTALRFFFGSRDGVPVLFPACSGSYFVTGTPFRTPELPCTNPFIICFA
jgi:hypothetical protein